MSSGIFSKETYYEPDKRYIENRLNLIKSNDGYHRLVTVHDDRIFYSDEKYSQNLDFLTAQQHHDFHTHVLLERTKRKWPVLNSEFGYECGPGGTATHNGPAHSPEELIHRAYEIVMAGGYIVYYYNFTAWDIIDYSHTPKGYEYFKILYDFFTSVEWWKLEPHPEFCSQKVRCLAHPGKEYIFYRREKLTEWGAPPELI